MNQIPISPDIWKLANTILTQKQLVVLELREKRGYSWHMIAITINRTKSMAKEHHRAATKNLLDAIEAAGSIEAAVKIAQPRPASEASRDVTAFPDPHRTTPPEWEVV